MNKRTHTIMRWHLSLIVKTISSGGATGRDWVPRSCFRNLCWRFLRFRRKFSDILPSCFYLLTPPLTISTDHWWILSTLICINRLYLTFISSTNLIMTENLLLIWFSFVRTHRYDDELETQCSSFHCITRRNYDSWEFLLINEFGNTFLFRMENKARQQMRMFHALTSFT